MTITDKVRFIRVRNPAASDDGQRRSDDRDTYDVVARCIRWYRAFRDASVCYPATLLTLPTAASWVRSHGCGVYARSPQGITFATAVGITPSRVMFDCARATGRTINDAVSLGVGQFVVDTEKTCVMLAACADQPLHTWIDVTSGATGELTKTVRAEELLTLTGLYIEAEDPEDAVLQVLGDVADLRSRHDLLVSRVGIALRCATATPPEALARTINDAVEEGCARFRLPRPAMNVYPDWTAVTRD